MMLSLLFLTLSVLQYSYTFSLVSMKPIQPRFAPSVSSSQGHKNFIHKITKRPSSNSFLGLQSTKNPSSSSSKEKKKVAIIGGGIAGLSCASHLSQLNNFEPTVFDTGRLRPGGRCSSRQPGDKSKDKNENRDRILNRFVIDHAAQILTVKDDGKFDEFMNQIRAWVNDGVLREFPPGSVVEILKDNKANQQNPTNTRSNGRDKTQSINPFIRSINSQSNDMNTSKKPVRMYYGANGMGSIPTAIAFPQSNNNEQKQSFQIHQDVWISPSNGVKFMGSTSVPKWKVQTNGKNFGTYDAVVIAHNGKCADRLMSKTPAKALHSLLRTNFSPNVPAWGGNKMTLNSIYSLTFALKKDSSPLSKVLKEDIMSGFIKNEPSLRFITCQTRKHKSAEDIDNIEVWTILSSAKFAKKYKGPQENLPSELSEEVVTLMLQGLRNSLGLEDDALHQGMILDHRLQLWGAAVPLNCYRWTESDDEVDTSKDGFVYDAENAVGACGDWLLDPSIMGAWESGRRLANWLEHSEEHSVGLPPDGGSFRVSKAASGSGIGNVR